MSEPSKSARECSFWNGEKRESKDNDLWDAPLMDVDEFSLLDVNEGDDIPPIPTQEEWLQFMKDMMNIPS